MLEKYQKLEPQHRYKYWLDVGNFKSGGQVILGSTYIKQKKSLNGIKTNPKLKNIIELYPDLEKDDKQEIQEASCNVPQTMERDDLFVNSMIAEYAANLLWNMLREGYATVNGLFKNLQSYKTAPIPIDG